MFISIIILIRYIMAAAAETQHIYLENDCDVIFVQNTISLILFSPTKSQALTFLCLMEVDGACRAKKR